MVLPTCRRNTHRLTLVTSVPRRDYRDTGFSDAAATVETSTRGISQGSRSPASYTCRLSLGIGLAALVVYGGGGCAIEVSGQVSEQQAVAIEAIASIEAKDAIDSADISRLSEPRNSGRAGASPYDIGNNGIHLNGIHLNGIHLNGIHLNGIHLNGIHLNGRGPGGIRVADVGLDRVPLDGLYINALGQNGVAWDGSGHNRVGPSGPGTQAITASGIYFADVASDTGNISAPAAHPTTDPIIDAKDRGLEDISVGGFHFGFRGEHTIVAGGARLIDIALAGLEQAGDGQDRVRPLAINGSGPRGLALATRLQDNDGNGGGDGNDSVALEAVMLRGTDLRGVGTDAAPEHSLAEASASVAIDIVEQRLAAVALNGLYLGRSRDRADRTTLMVGGGTADLVDLMNTGLDDLHLGGSGPRALRLGGGGIDVPLTMTPQQERDFEAVMFYLVGCALPADRTVRLHRASGDPIIYRGARGLAPAWQHGPLYDGDGDGDNRDAQQRVLACLANSDGAYPAQPLHNAQAQVLADVLRPIIACALPADRAVTILDATQRPVRYHGLRGVAPEWEHGPLSRSGEIALRACLHTWPRATFGVALNPEQEQNLHALLPYMAECALDADQAITGYAGDGTPMTFRGAMGLAPEWARAPLTSQSARLVSACLAARVNGNGQTVQISLRGGGIAVTPTERALYRHYEGAFWGNFFAEDAAISTCAVDGGNISGRTCTSPGGCGFNYRGSCAEVCSEYDNNGRFSRCDGDDAILSAYLPLTRRTEFGNGHACLIRPSHLLGTQDDDASFDDDAHRRRTVWCMGQNDFGQLGDKTTTSRASMRPTAAPIPSPPASEPPDEGADFSEVSGGTAHTCARRSDGKTYCWGSNVRGQLGSDDEHLYQPVPTEVWSLGSDTASLRSGANHVCALDTQGQARCWGDNFYGQLGDGSTVDRPHPTTVDLPEPAAYIASSESANHTCAIDNLGQMYCWGWNESGQLGNGHRQNQSTPGPVLPEGRQANDHNVQFADVCTGWLHTCAATTHGRVMCWGSNGTSQLGPKARGMPFSTRPVPVPIRGRRHARIVPGGLACGREHTCALIDDGTVQCWGDNAQGQSGRISTKSRHDRSRYGKAIATTVHPTTVSPNTVRGLPRPLPPDSILTADASHSCVMVPEVGAWCWGRDLRGWLFGDTAIHARPTRVALTP